MQQTVYKRPLIWMTDKYANPLQLGCDEKDCACYFFRQCLGSSGYTKCMESIRLLLSSLALEEGEFCVVKDMFLHCKLAVVQLHHQGLGKQVYFAPFDGA